jgi:predicted dithiol-disulfide oxidoreductase (DUF899 family)
MSTSYDQDWLQSRTQRPNNTIASLEDFLGDDDQLIAYHFMFTMMTMVAVLLPYR